MALNLVSAGYQYFPDFDRGRPVYNGYIYVGEPDLDPEILANQKALSVIQEDGTIVSVSQPIRTSSGGVPTYNGSPVQLSVDGNYSLKVLNRFGVQVFYLSNAFNGRPVTDDQVSIYYDTIQSADSDDLQIGVKIKTRGYRSKGDGGGNEYTVVAGGTGSADGGTYIDLGNGNQLEASFSDYVNPMQFGAYNDGVSNDTPYIQALFDALIGDLIPAVRRVRMGKEHLLSSGINISSVGAKRYDIEGGENIESTNIICDFNGYGSNSVSRAVLQFGDNGSPSYQTSVGIGGLLFTRGPNCNRAPIGISGDSLAQSRINDITFGSWNNVTMSLNTPQNCRGQNFTTFGGGVSFEYKDASSITVTQSADVLTASGSIFSASDVGKTVAIWGISTAYRRKAKVTSFISSTQVNVEKIVNDATPRNLYFGSPFASINSGSVTLVADAACFTSDHVGLVIWVKGAGANGGLLRAVISLYVSPTEVSLSEQAQTSTSKAEFCTPAAEIYSDDSFGNGASDNRFYGVQIEDHNGTGLCVYDSDILYIEGKIHGEQSVSSDDYSVSAVWADRWGGVLTGSFDAQYIGEDRSWFGNNTTSLHVVSLFTRSARNEVVARIGPRNPTFEGATVVFGDVNVIGDDSNDDIRGSIIVDENLSIPGYSLMGAFTRSEFNDTKMFLGRNVFSDVDGAMACESISFDNLGNNLDTYIATTSFTPEIADAPSGGNLAGGTFTGLYERIGNIVHVSIVCFSIDTTGMTGSNNIYIRGLPVSVRGGTNSRFSDSLRMDNITFSGFVSAYADNNDDFFLLYDNISGSPSTTLKVSSVSSGIGNIYLSASYMAEDI